MVNEKNLHLIISLKHVSSTAGVATFTEACLPNYTFYQSIRENRKGAKDCSHSCYTASMSRLFYIFEYLTLLEYKNIIKVVRHWRLERGQLTNWDTITVYNKEKCLAEKDTFFKIITKTAELRNDIVHHWPSAQQCPSFPQNSNCSEQNSNYIQQYCWYEYDDLMNSYKNLDFLFVCVQLSGQRDVFLWGAFKTSVAKPLLRKQTNKQTSRKTTHRSTY